MERLSLGCVVWSWMFPAASSSLLQGSWDGCPVCTMVMCRSLCSGGSCSHPGVTNGGVPGVPLCTQVGSRAGPTLQGWSALENQVQWCLSSPICERLAQANSRSCWLVSSCEIYLFNSKRIARGSEHLCWVMLLHWTIPSGEQVTCTEEMEHAACSQKATIVSREQRLPPRVYCSYCHIPSDKGTAFLKFFSFSILMHY